MDAIHAYSDTLLWMYLHAEKHAHQSSNIFICCVSTRWCFYYIRFMFFWSNPKEIIVKYDYNCKHSLHVIIIHSDHKPLAHFLSSDKHEGIYGHWADQLRRLHFKIQYIYSRKKELSRWWTTRTLFQDSDCEANDDILKALKILCCNFPDI